MQTRRQFITAAAKSVTGAAAITAAGLLPALVNASSDPVALEFQPAYGWGSGLSTDPNKPVVYSQMPVARIVQHLQNWPAGTKVRLYRDKITAWWDGEWLKQQPAYAVRQSDDYDAHGNAFHTARQVEKFARYFDNHGVFEFGKPFETKLATDSLWIISDYGSGMALMQHMLRHPQKAQAWPSASNALSSNT